MTVTEPVLVIAFNRPDHFRRVLQRLREVDARSIYVAIDGPRTGRDDEAARVQECRDMAGAIDWTTDLHFQFQSENLGCGAGVSSGISWFFENVDRGIILEDDIVPNDSFFDFCETLLDRYEFDDRVFAISGANVVPAEAISSPLNPYRFTHTPLIWGWATWKRSWAQHRLDERGWYRTISPRRMWASSGGSLAGAMFWATNMELTARGDVDTWDWQLVFAAMRTGQVVAVPNVNLVENIGFDEWATHTVHGESALPEPRELRLGTDRVPVKADSRADSWSRKHFYGARTLTSVHRLWKYFRGERREAGLK
jgi:hypothetical protein